MPASTKESIKKRKSQLLAQLQALTAKETMQKRKEETRMKFLIGDFFFNKYKNNETFEDLIKEIDAFLIRKNDRALFNLKPLEEIKK